ncbi:MAG TPA: SPFH domain-containing protein, partial [Anaerolineae bacterium]|nr:SPFH domain-containing protein [Anaerolineae bacterium]
FTRVEGARQVRLEAFEKIWDTVDLRPQRRELRVTANTRDGIPVTCRAEVRFRALRGDAEPIPQLTAPPLDFTDADRAIALRLGTDKVVLAPGGERAVTDWMIFLTNGTFDGEVRNRIERYRLDELFDPNRNGPALLTLIEEELTEAMRQIGKGRGIQIDQVHLLSLTPDEELIPEQWMALWRSQWERTAAKDEAAARAAHESEIEKAKARARAEMIAAMVQPLADLTDADLDTLLMGVQLEFLEVMRGMAQMDPLVQSVMFQQVENLERLIRELLQLPGASSPGGALPPAGSAPPPTGNTP